MTRRRDLVGYLGLSGALLFTAGTTGRARESVEPDASRPRVPNRLPSRSRVTSIPFTLDGRSGRVAVTYGVTEDPVAVGFDVIPNLHFDVSLCRGYPNVHAVIEKYGGAGYRGLCGWIQVVTGKRYRAGSENSASADTSIDVDKLPSIANMNLPFAVWGYLPEWFDAPCRNLNGYERLRWTADTFLTTVPIRSRTEGIRRLAGFRWGYVEYDPSAHRPVSPLPLEATGADAWNGLLPFLRQSSPGWGFAAAD
jgi:hypothetical protein